MFGSWQDISEFFRGECEILNKLVIEYHINYIHLFIASILCLCFMSFIPTFIVFFVALLDVWHTKGDILQVKKNKMHACLDPP